ncbi:hypothetical protein IEQ34_016330 [Dendrobium chrysotoxum]|uniref:BHLH domain-containing protein n=1 Tax=Dendrobium chrysotoxum TaxID=161865 RepID=A0AAV7GD75_DENCH|nr:hypothetical protein IEQ34_016330 [Dendrobium chrysotoxum]
MEIERREEEGGEEEEGLVELLLSSPSCTNYSSSMFCYGCGGGQEDGAQRSSDSSSLSTLSSSPSSNAITTCSKASIKEEEINGCMRSSGGSKKAKKDGAGSKGTIKVRKERLGDRIAALQQLVSPFGKSDTASVLHEALAYIRFLHEQVQVLSSPYLLQRLPSSVSLQGKEEGGMELEDLQSRGLCLVPLTCTMQVPNTNGADLWAPSNSNFSITKPTTSSPPNPSS